MRTGRITNPWSETKIARFVRDLMEAWNDHELGRIEKFYAPGYEGVDVGLAGPQRGPQSVSRNTQRYLRAFPDLRLVEQALIVQSNRGVHGTSVLTAESEKVTRGLYVWDVAGLLRSIGLLPELYQVKRGYR